MKLLSLLFIAALLGAIIMAVGVVVGANLIKRRIGDLPRGGTP